jgi:histidinol-phosphate aminotransferase
MDRLCPVRYSASVQSVDGRPLVFGPLEKELQRGRSYKVRLGANESNFGPSPRSLSRLPAGISSIGRYGDPTNAELRRALADKWHLAPQNFLIGEGIEGLLELFARCLLDPGDTLVISRGTYPTIRKYARSCGAKILDVPYSPSGAVEVAGLIAASIEHEAKVLYLANPDNPTGAVLSKDELQMLCREIPASTVLLIDEAYAEYAAPRHVPEGVLGQNIVRLRTFSKAYGLAGARVGYGIACEDVLENVERLRQRYGVSTLAQELALGALEDEAFLAQVVHANAMGRAMYMDAACDAGIGALASQANFVAFDFGGFAAGDVALGFFESNDLLVARPTEASLGRYVRITVGLPEECNFVTELLRTLPDGARWMHGMDEMERRRSIGAGSKIT